MNTKRIEARTNISYTDMVEKILDDESMSVGKLLFYLCRELTILQKYILELLLNRLLSQIKIKELLNK